MVKSCGEDYVSADAYCQLPGETNVPLDFADEKKIEAPLLARSAKLSKEETRMIYGIEPTASTRVVLVGFGGHDTQWTLTNTSLPPGWVAWVLGAQEMDLPEGGLFRPIPFETFVPDLINAADVVLGKLGNNPSLPVAISHTYTSHTLTYALIPSMTISCQVMVLFLNALHMALP